jgi:hypothetical protein
MKTELRNFDFEISLSIVLLDSCVKVILLKDMTLRYSKTPIYRAPIYRVPRFTGPNPLPPKFFQ